ncbi:nucleoside permease [Flavobacterium sp.]|uniref:nucleoside permease n=1 Tax=Flavobacterium sp. TaxID=239 RepID=UPI0039E6AB30
MSIKFRLTLMNFLQFFIWGSYLTSLGGYLYSNLHFEGEQIGLVYTTLGIASLFMPTLTGIIADRWVNSERVLGACHILGAISLYAASTITDPNTFFWVMLLVSMFYMPTIALNNTVSYNILVKNGSDIQKDFPNIRVWGTIGFICAMWFVDLNHWTIDATQLVVASISALALGIYAFTMPPCPPLYHNDSKGLISTLGLDAFVLLKRKKMVIFFLFAMLLGAALQVTNQWGVPFIDHFKYIDEFKDTLGVKFPNILVSISQISETVFILTIPFFLKRFGIKKVMIISIVAWIIRFGLFAIGDPGSGLYLLILSMIVYGMAFDFFNISGSLFVENEADESIRASAQGLFMLLTNGVGAMIGSYGSGWVVQRYTENNLTDWSTVWTIFAAYALILAVVFPFVFKYKHDPKAVENIAH